jgi:hypothetical protein
MASGPTHPNEQLKKRTRSAEAMNGTVNRTAVIGPHEQAKEAPVVRGSGPIGPHEQAAVTVSGEIADPAPPYSAAKSRRKNGSASSTEIVPSRLRFTLSLHAKLSKRTDFSLCVFSPDRNRGPVVIESIHVGIYRKGERMFDGDVPIRKDANINPGMKKVLPFSDAQKKQLGRVMKSKTFAFVSATYTALPQTEVKFSIESQDSKAK